MTPNRIPFKQMRGTIAALEVAVLPVIATLKADALDREQVKFVSTILIVRDMTIRQTKNNPTRRQMLILCTAWYKLAEGIGALIPADQPQLAEGVNNILRDVLWVKDLNLPMNFTNMSKAATPEGG